MLITICRLYNSCSDASRVVLLLHMAGIPASETSIVANNCEGWYKSSHTAVVAPAKKGDTEHPAGRVKIEVSAVDAAFGTTTAGSLIVVLALPGVGTVVGAGWLATILGNIANDSAGRSLLGLLSRVGAAEQDGHVFAEGVRRGGALVVVRVSPKMRPHIETLMDHWAVNLRERCDLYRKAGWLSFDPNAEPYTADQVRCERMLHAVSTGGTPAFPQPSRAGVVHELFRL
jgi:hypothetical protein